MAASDPERKVILALGATLAVRTVAIVAGEQRAPSMSDYLAPALAFTILAAFADSYPKPAGWIAAAIFTGVLLKDGKAFFTAVGGIQAALPEPPKKPKPPKKGKGGRNR